MQVLRVNNLIIIQTYIRIKHNYSSIRVCYVCILVKLWYICMYIVVFQCRNGNLTNRKLVQFSAMQNGSFKEKLQEAPFYEMHFGHFDSLQTMRVPPFIHRINPYYILLYISFLPNILIVFSPASAYSYLYETVGKLTEKIRES